MVDHYQLLFPIKPLFSHSSLTIVNNQPFSNSYYQPLLTIVKPFFTVTPPKHQQFRVGSGFARQILQEGGEDGAGSGDILGFFLFRASAPAAAEGGKLDQFDPCGDEEIMGICDFSYERWFIRESLVIYWDV